MANNNNEIFTVPIVYMPNGSPAPYILTAEEAVRFLRIDTNGTKHPENTLQHYITEGLLFPITIGKCRKYPLPELLRFIDRLSKLKKNAS